MPRDSVAVSFCPGRGSDWIYSDAWPWSRNQSVGSLGLFPRRTMTYPRTMVPLVFRKKNAARLDESKLVHSFAFHLYQVVIFSPMLLYAICLSIQRTECKKLRPLYQNPVMVLVNFMSFSVTFFWIWDWRLIQKRTYIDLLFLPTRLSWNSQPFCVRYSLDSELYSEAGPVVRYEIKRPYQELEYCQNHMSFASGLGMAQWKSPPCSDNNPGMEVEGLPMVGLWRFMHLLVLVLTHSSDDLLRPGSSWRLTAGLLLCLSAAPNRTDSGGSCLALVMGQLYQCCTMLHPSKRYTAIAI